MNSTQGQEVKKQRLHLLAEGFLRITENRSQSDSIGSIEIGNRTPGGVTLTMQNREDVEPRQRTGTRLINGSLTTSSRA